MPDLSLISTEDLLTELTRRKVPEGCAYALCWKDEKDKIRFGCAGSMDRLSLLLVILQRDIHIRLSEENADARPRR